LRGRSSESTNVEVDIVMLLALEEYAGDTTSVNDKQDDVKYLQQKII
jgi:hypothetical protein